jgi:DeoR family transcriptional regulator of aga operon
MKMTTDRQTRILEYLAGHDKLEVAQLSELLRVSPSTIRRELSTLEKGGMLVRTHGAAQLTSPIHYDAPYEKRAAQQIQAKRNIAATTKSLVERGMVVGISGGSTCTELARQMRATEGLTVVTNAVNVALELQGQLGKRVMITGGTLTEGSYELVGNQVVESLQRVHLDLAFVGASGIDLDFGFSVSDEPEAVAGRALMAAADRSVIIADHTKIGRATFARLCRLIDVNLLVTDDRITPKQREALEQAGLEVLVAESVF